MALVACQGWPLPPAAGMQPQGMLPLLRMGHEQTLFFCRLIGKPACSQQVERCSAVLDCEQHLTYTYSLSQNTSCACALLSPAESLMQCTCLLQVGQRAG